MKKEDRTIHWGMIGCGDVTEVKNGPGLYLADYSELKGVFNRTGAKAEDWVRRHGRGRVYRTASELLSDPEIDIVYVATTPDCHKQFAIECAAAGKHCYLEKPIALSYEEALEIKEAFDSSGTQIFVAHYRRGMTRYKEIKKQLESGAVGKVRGVQILRTQMQTEEEKLPEEKKPWRVRSNISGGSHFFEGDIHMLDLIDFLVGPAENFKLEASNETGYYKGEDVVALSMITDMGVMVSGLWCYAAYKELDRVLIFGDEGSLSFCYGKNEEPYRLENGDGVKEYSTFVHPNVGTEQIQDIVDTLRGCGSCSSTLEAAMRSLRITDAAVKQMRNC